MMKKSLVAAIFAAVMFAAGVAEAAAGRLVAKWDFDNYDPENPTSAAILAPTVGNLAAVPCTGSSPLTEVTDGTLGSITVRAPSETGLPDGDYALELPNGANLWLPLPSGIVRDKNWTVRIRFYVPSSAPNTLTALISGRQNDNVNNIWFVSINNIIQGGEAIFGTAAEENKNITGNGTTAFRQVSRNMWHTFTSHFGANATSSTLDGYRSVSLSKLADVRTYFSSDGFVINGGAMTKWVASVEVWEDTPIYRDGRGAAYLQTTSTTLFNGCSLEDIRDMYITVKGLGGWGSYARSMSSWEHVVTTDAGGNVTDLKIDLRGKSAGDAILCDFQNSDANVAGNTLRMQWSLAWPNHYFTTSGGFASSANYKAAQTAYNGDGYAAYNLYALPFRPLDGSLTWSMQMGYGKFGDPFFTIVGDNPTLTFDVAPAVDSLSLDCGRGDGQAGVTFAYSSTALKTMTEFGDLNVGSNVRLTVPYGVSIAGTLALTNGASMVIDNAGSGLGNGDVVFTASGGIALPEGKTIGDMASVLEWGLELSQDGTQILLTPDPNIVLTATWVGLGDRSDVADPLNWECRNYAGTVLPGKVPEASTAISIGGTTTFNYPTNQVGRLAYASISIGTSITLAADCDWRGFGAAIPYSAKPTIDLQGNKLYVSDYATAANITNTTLGVSGEYHLDLSANATVSALNMTGNVRFVKEGSAEMKLNYSTNPTYTGGTEIRGGRIASTQSATDKKQFGPIGSEIIIRSGGELYPYNHENWLTHYPIVLDGGSIYTWWAGTANGVVIGSMSLLADSWLDVYSGGRMRIWSGHIVTLNGYTLSLIGAGEKCLSQGGAKLTFTEGVVDLQAGTMSLGGVVYATNTTWLVGGALNLGGNTLNASNYVARYTGSSNSGTGALKVYGTFRPESTKFYGPTMQDGSTMDFSAWPGALPVVSGFTSGNRDVKFASGATVKVEMGESLPDVGSCLVAYNAGTVPDVSTVNFVLCTNGVTVADRAVARRDDATGSGLFVVNPNEPSYAMWVNGAFKFYMENGDEYDGEWTGGVTDKMQVRFSTGAEYAAICAAVQADPAIAPSQFVLTGFTGAPGVTNDFAGAVSFDFAEGAVFDANGGYLKLPSSMAGGSKAFTVTNTAEQDGTLEVEVAEEVTATNTKMTLAGNLKFVKSGAGTFAADKASQTYSGGTEIREGYVVSTQDATKKYQFGASGNEIVVKSGGTLYPHSHESWLSVYKVVLDGGRMYTFWAGTDNGVIFGSLDIKSDSTIKTSSDGGRFTLWQGNTATLNGHKVLIAGGGDMIFGHNVKLYNGTFESESNTTVKINGTVTATNVTFDVGGKLNMNGGPLNASNYVARYAGPSNSGTGALNVYGTFKPSAHNYFYGCTLQDGAEMDLSARTNALPLVSSCTDGLTTLQFADYATIRIKLGERAMANGTKIVGWASAPANIGTLKFKCAKGESFSVAVKDDGLYIQRGLIILLR